MTANMVVTVVLLALLLGLLTPRRDRRPRAFSPVALVAVLAVQLPLLYPPFVPLSHILFEFSTAVTRIGSLVIMLLLLGSVGHLLVLRTRLGPLPVQLVLLWVLFGCATFWSVLAVVLSGFESGPTPAALDHRIYVVQCLSLYAAAGAEAALFVIMRRAAHADRRRGSA